MNDPPLPIDEYSTETKPWWQSRAVIGSLVSSAAVLAAMAGIQVDVGVATELVLGAVAIAGNALAWWGRVKASRPISTKQVLPGLTRR